VDRFSKEGIMSVSLRSSRMRAWGLLLFTCACVASATAEVPAPASKRVEDPVRLEALPRPGSWMNAPQAFERPSANALSITAASGTDLYADNGTEAITTNAPMLLFTADDDFTLTARLATDFASQFDGGFLVLYASPHHWAKLLFEKSHYGPLSVCSAVTQGISDDTVNGEVAERVIWLRIAKTGRSAVFYASSDGKAWRYQRYFRFDGPGPVSLGFGAQSPLGPQSTTVFSEIHYVPKAPADFWTGE
jgi:regulation of enolase protein 1 (concanavalin A-like superfamily)